jgi:SAM-dependent methyltransferase
MMTVEKFFELFLEELKGKQHLWSYYKFHTDEKSFLFRKAYLCQRLEYVLKHIHDPKAKVLDIGCGYGTTALFLAMNGIPVHGTTLEFYIEEIDSRKQFWKQYGNVDLFTVSYENLFDTPPKDQYDFIIIQDTLHHLEPINDALAIIKNTLKPSGQLVVIEENGDNIVQNLKLLKQRGFKKTKYIYDETLKKDILIGDENIRGYETWKALMANNGLKANDHSRQYIRYFYPNKFTKEHYLSQLAEEQNIWQKSNFKRKYFFFGVNFLVGLK